MEDGSPATDQAPMYISARFFYGLAPANPSAPAAMTRRRAESILAKKGAVLDIDVKATPFPLHSCSMEQEQPYARTRALARSAEWTARTPTKDVPADGELLVELEISDREFIQQLVDRRDPDIAIAQALQTHPVHWGTQNWGGLTIGIGCQGARLYRCDVDVFSAEDLDGVSDRVLFYALSADPELYGADDEAPTEPHVGGSADESADITVGRCLDCGTDLTLASVLLAVSKQSGGFAIVPCRGCKKTSLVRILDAAEGHHRKYLFEIVRSPESKTSGT